MNCILDHISINVSDLKKSTLFYDTFLTFIGFRKTRHYNAWVNGPYRISLDQTEEKYLLNKFHRKNVGVNHVCFKVSSKQGVDEFYERCLKSNNIPVLYGGPKAYPEYSENYYAVYFEDPDRLKLEVMWM